MAKSNRETGTALLSRRIRAANVPSPRPGNLRIATWNVRELGKGARLEESLKMIAAIIGAFDVVSIVELRDHLRDFMKILRLRPPLRLTPEHERPVRIVVGHEDPGG